MKNILCFLFVLQNLIIFNGFCDKTLSSSLSSSTVTVPTAIGEEGYFENIERERVLESSYHGLIKENETLVEITPEIKIDETKKICGFEIEKNLKKKIPFEIELVSNLGVLRATKSLNCEKRKNYRFEISAVFCDGRKSKSAQVHISVSDVNEFAPEFMQPSYVIEVDEGRLYDEIIRLEAIDKDCTPRFGDVCKYEIRRNDDHLFAIDSEGSIKNLRPLEYKKSHNHILEVYAYDCAMKKSITPALLNIRVRKICESRFFGIPERIDYAANSMESITLFPKLHLEVCDEFSCDNDDDDLMTIETEVALKTKHIGFGCDLNDVETDSDMIDLLPKNAPWTRDVKYDEGSEKVFHFDGNFGIVLPKNVVTPKIENFFEHSFAIYTMFRHKGHTSVENSDVDDKHRKEHIICAADDHKMNRHHFSLFIRNCRLILLVRRHFRPSSLNNIFSPAEWRWKVPEVCDNEWHRYVINWKSQDGGNEEEGDGQDVTLYIDGRPTTVEPEVIDDWPLHPSHGLEMTMTLAACWQGRENRLRHQFSGDISEIKLKVGTTLAPDSHLLSGDGVTGKCAERIRYVDTLSNGVQVLSNEGHNNMKTNNNTTTSSEWTIVQSDHGLDIMKSRNDDVILVREQIVLKSVDDEELNAAVAATDDEDDEEDDDESDDEVNDDFEEKSSTNTNINNSSNEDKYDRLITALKKIKYENLKKNQTTIGRRNLEIRTRIFCSKKLNGIKGDKLHLNRKEKVFTLPEQETYIMITKDNNREHITVDGKKSEMHTESSQFKTIMENESSKKISGIVTEKTLETNHIDAVNHADPEIIISGPSGSENNYVTYPSIKSGVRIFQELNFHLTSGGDSTLDSCHVTIFPALNFDHEQMTVDDLDVTNENVHLKFIKDGVEVFGTESFEKYSKILDSIVYSNKKPAFYLNRVFKLKCEKADEGHQIESNEYGVTLTVLHPKQTPSTPIATSPTTEASSVSGGGNGHHEEKTQVKFAHAMIHPHEVQEPQNHLRNIIKGQSASHSTMLIVVICVVFVLLICGVGIARLRNNSVAAKNKSLGKKNKKCEGDDDGASGSGHCMKNREDHQQLDWDDSSLTITINPMQDGQLMPMSDDSSESENSDSEDEEIINGRYKNVSQLEWDNSTI